MLRLRTDTPGNSWRLRGGEGTLRAMKIEFETHPYVNPAFGSYTIILVDGNRIESYRHVDGGFAISMRRNPKVYTDENKVRIAAVSQRISRLENELSRLRSVVSELS